MLLDSRLQLCNAQVVTTAAISNVVDLGATPTLRCLPQAPVLRITVDTLPEVGDGDVVEVTFSLESSAAEDLTGSTVHWQSAPLDDTALVAGTEVAAFALPAYPPYRRYLALRITPTDTLVAGAFSAHIVSDPAVHMTVPDSPGVS